MKFKSYRSFILILKCIGALWLAVVTTSAQTFPGKGSVCFQQDFEGTKPLAGWTGTAPLDPGFRSAHAVRIDQTNNDGASSMIAINLPAEPLRGCRLTASAMIKAQDVTTKPNSWNGIKYMISIESPAGKTYPQADLGTGTLDWRKAAFTLRVPADATKITVHLGLEKVRGKAWFDDLKIVVAKPPFAPRPIAMPGNGFTGHAAPRLRGAMVSPTLDEVGLRVLGHDWNANLIRWQLIRSEKPGQSLALADYDHWLDTQLARLDSLLPSCEKYGVYVLIDLHSPPGGKGTAGGYAGSDSSLFTDRACQDKLVAVWRRIAQKYRGSKAIWGYDLANEPVEDLIEDGCDDWQALAERTAKAIRGIDPERAIIVEAPPWGGPDSLAEFYPIDVSNVVYSVHMYVPHTFTHQGVFNQSIPVEYPGMIDGKLWDKAALEEALKPTIDFQKRYHTAIYIGEFSAIRWAPNDSAYRYLKDAIDIFEAHGWDWSYHAFREWDGWSVEHTGDREHPTRAAAETTRQRLLREWFEKNRK